MPSQMAVHGPTPLNGDERGREPLCRLPGAPLSFFFVFYFFLSYFLNLTGADAVPNGREGPNADEQRQTGWGTVVRAAWCAPIFFFLSFFF
jgi:hypothetical protein